MITYKRAKITVTSVTCDPAEEDRILAEHNGDREAAKKKLDEASERVDMSLYGDIYTEDGQTIIRYTGHDGAFCTLSFLPSEPCAVTVTRESCDGSFVLFCSERDPVVDCSYKMLGMSFPMTLLTHGVQNTIKKKKGQIRLNYTLSARGVPMQRVRVSVKVLPVEEEISRREKKAGLADS